MPSARRPPAPRPTRLARGCRQSAAWTLAGLLVCALAASTAGCPRAPSRATSTPHLEAPSDGDRALLPGACVEPTTDARRRLGEDARDGELRVEQVLDLDADGVPDPFVAHPSFCGSGGCVWQLYVSRGGCAHWVGELFGIWPLPGQGRTLGLTDLEVAARNGCAGAARTESRASFDGARYAVTATRECHCPSVVADPATEDDTPDPEASCDPWSPASPSPSVGAR
jgi:hypothetical protein